LLAPSMMPLVSGMTSDKVAKGDGFSAFVGRYLAGAFRHDLGDVLNFNGSDVLTDENAGKTQITVGLFMSDQNMNGMSDLGASFTSSFIVGTDVFVDASTAAWVDIDWKPMGAGGEPKHMKIPNWPSSTEGIMVVTFQ